MVSIVGRPNVGKSTLLNRIVGEKVAIVSKIPQTTRNPVRGIYTDERGQIVFVDTPGVHLAKDRLDKFMNQSAYSTTSGADCLVYVVDVNDPIGPEETSLAQHVAALKTPIILVLNKVDVSDKFIPQYISLWEEVSGTSLHARPDFTLLPLSGKAGINVEKLIDIIYEYVPKGPAMYPVDIVSDVPRNMVISDIIREKFFAILRAEVPHALAVLIENMQPRQKGVLYIQALALVETRTQKMIVVGKNGQVLKKVGSSARMELEELLEQKVFLEIFVKEKKHWRDNADLLEEMGYCFV